MTKRWIMAAALVTVSVALAQTISRSFDLVVAGQPFAKKAYVIGGETYVPLSSLQPLGVTRSLSGTVLTLETAKPDVAAGGANPLAGLEGCLGETLFNGMYRFKAVSFEPGDVGGKAGYLLNVEVRNGTPRSQYLANTGFYTSGPGNYVLTPADGNSGIWEVRNPVNFAGRTLPQAAFFNYTLEVRPSATATAEELAQPPTKFILRVKKVQYPGVAYTVPDPSYRIKLDCKK